MESDTPRVDVARLTKAATCAEPGCREKIAAGTAVFLFRGEGFDGRVRCREHQKLEGERFAATAG
jgi:hypothetical protein